MTGLGDGCETRGRDFLTGGDGATAGFDPGGACCGTAMYEKQFHSCIKQEYKQHENYKICTIQETLLHLNSSTDMPAK